MSWRRRRRRRRRCWERHKHKRGRRGDWRISCRMRRCERLRLSLSTTMTMSSRTLPAKLVMAHHQWREPVQALDGIDDEQAGFYATHCVLVHGPNVFTWAVLDHLEASLAAIHAGIAEKLQVGFLTSHMCKHILHTHQAIWAHSHSLSRRTMPKKRAHFAAEILIITSISWMATRHPERELMN
jgi:hypothetical protein